ncbi:peptidoglycan DD-metalloendopeptidase family protein [Paraglaciecola marina]|uniref:peptidoglycan DD-metalloendopeptidase family protein n=1 Tax=Paraglaciecola marina TaxID=2500157 RepID=UPI00105D9FEB|nr:peptidoglycan DD-metalloendopeptidase family protein [Paraglaciecola marina]
MKKTPTKRRTYSYANLGSLLLFSSIFLWGCSSRKTPAPVVELYQGKTYKDFEKQGYEGKYYKVQTGDTLFSIAWYSGQDYRDLAKLNKISSPYNIYPGQRLLLTEGKKTNPVKTNKITTTSPQKIKKQAIDPPKKQAYGKSEEIVNGSSAQSLAGKFPDQVKNWSWPTKGIISRGFSSKDEGNKGLDFDGKHGASILAAADGKVVYTGDALRGFGKLVIIKHSEAYLTAYAHNDTILVKEQQWIKLGDKIATMGKSGTDKVKLHFEVRYKGKSVNPLRYLPKR